MNPGGSGFGSNASSHDGSKTNANMWNELSLNQFHYGNYQSGYPANAWQGAPDLRHYGYGFPEASVDGSSSSYEMRLRGEVVPSPSQRRVPSKGETKATPPLSSPTPTPTMASLQQLVARGGDQAAFYQSLLVQQYAAAAAALGGLPSGLQSASLSPPGSSLASRQQYQRKHQAAVLASMMAAATGVNGDSLAALQISPPGRNRYTTSPMAIADGQQLSPCLSNRSCLETPTPGLANEGPMVLDGSTGVSDWEGRRTLSESESEGGDIRARHRRKQELPRRQNVTVAYPVAPLDETYSSSEDENYVSGGQGSLGREIGSPSLSHLVALERLERCSPSLSQHISALERASPALAHVAALERGSPMSNRERASPALSHLSAFERSSPSLSHLSTIERSSPALSLGRERGSPSCIPHSESYSSQTAVSQAMCHALAHPFLAGHLSRQEHQMSLPDHGGGRPDCVPTLRVRSDLMATVEHGKEETESLNFAVEDLSSRGLKRTRSPGSDTTNPARAIEEAMLAGPLASNSAKLNKLDHALAKCHSAMNGAISTEGVEVTAVLPELLPMNGHLESPKKRGRPKRADSLNSSSEIVLPVLEPLLEDVGDETRRRTRQKRAISYVEDGTDPVLETVEDATIAPNEAIGLKRRGRRRSSREGGTVGGYEGGLAMHTVSVEINHRPVSPAGRLGSSDAGNVATLMASPSSDYRRTYKNIDKWRAMGQISQSVHSNVNNLSVITGIGESNDIDVYDFEDLEAIGNGMSGGDRRAPRAEINVGYSPSSNTRYSPSRYTVSPRSVNSYRPLILGKKLRAANQLNLSDNLFDGEQQSPREGKSGSANSSSDHISTIDLEQIAYTDHVSVKDIFHENNATVSQNNTIVSENSIVERDPNENLQEHYNHNIDSLGRTTQLPAVAIDGDQHSNQENSNHQSCSTETSLPPTNEVGSNCFQANSTSNSAATYFSTSIINITNEPVSHLAKQRGNVKGKKVRRKKRWCKKAKQKVQLLHNTLNTAASSLKVSDEKNARGDTNPENAGVLKRTVEDAVFPTLDGKQDAASVVTGNESEAKKKGTRGRRKKIPARTTATSVDSTTERSSGETRVDSEAETVENIARFTEGSVNSSGKVITASDPSSECAIGSSSTSTEPAGLSYCDRRPKRTRPPREMSDAEVNEIVALFGNEDESEDEDYVPNVGGDEEVEGDGEGESELEDMLSGEEEVKEGSGRAKKAKCSKETKGKGKMDNVLQKRTSDVKLKREESKRKEGERRGPLIRLGLDDVIVNEDETERLGGTRKGAVPFYCPVEIRPRTSRQGYNSTLNGNYDAFTKDIAWFCAFCKSFSHAAQLGDLFGPYFVESLSVVKKVEPTVIDGQVAVPVMPCQMKEGKKGRGKHPSRRESQTDTSKMALDVVSFSPPGRFVPIASPARGPVRNQAIRELSSISDPCTPVEGSVDGDAVPLGTECWLHERCLVWAPGVHVANGKLYGLVEALVQAQESVCEACGETGATVACLGKGCSDVVHVPCAVARQWTLDTITFHSLCPVHQSWSNYCGLPPFPALGTCFDFRHE